MVLNTRPLKIHQELIVVGVPVKGVHPDDQVDCEPGYEQLITLIIAAHDKPGNSPEVQALKSFLGSTSPEWRALVAMRKRSIEEERLIAIAGRVFLDLIEMLATGPATEYPAGSGYYAIRVSKADWDAWRQKLAQITTNYPYPGD